MKRNVAAANRKVRKDETSDIIETLGHSLSFIVMGVLEAKLDEFNCRERKLANLFEFVQEEKRKWNLDYETWDIIGEAKGKRKHVYEACQRIPFSQLLRLAEIRPGKGKSTDYKGIRVMLQGGFCIIGVWIDTVLQEHYRFSVEKRQQFFDYVIDWIDSYQKGYVNNEGIREQFLEDLNYDIVKGARNVN